MMTCGWEVKFAVRRRKRSSAIMKKQIQIANIVVGLFILTIFLGCADKPSFQFNAVSKKEAENGTPFSAEQSQDVANILTALFGTPDDPAMPNVNSFHWYLQYDEGYAEDFATLVDFENLKRSAGPVSSDENGDSRGLYREHCAHCHGISGGGDGPTALTLNPYLRDFRHGVYKFKSTSGKARPTDDDLMHIINEVTVVQVPVLHVVEFASLLLPLLKSNSKHLHHHCQPLILTLLLLLPAHALEVVA